MKIARQRTVGNGKISDYFYICPEDFAFERYTELYVKTDISDKFLAYTDDYDNAIENKAADFEKVGENRSNSFTVEVIDKAKNDLADAKQEYSDNKEKTEKKLADAKTAIDDNEADGNLYKLFGKISTGQYTRAQQSFLIVFFSSSANRICSRTELDSCTISFTVLL